MKRIAILAALLCAALPPRTSDAQQRLSHGLFDDVALYRPAGEPTQFVLFLSGADGWNARATALAKQLVQRGAMVAGIDSPRLFAKLAATGGNCVFPDGDLENLSHYLQGYAHLSTYHTPLLAGYSSGASLAYAMQSQAQPGIFAGLLTLGPIPPLQLPKPLCPGKKAHLPSSWIAMPEDAGDGSHQSFVAAYEKLAATNTTTALPPPPASLSDLPLIEVQPAQVQPAAGASSTFAVLLSGDGGWAGLDKQVAAALAARGVAVVGLDSLRYFWSKRTPEGLASDLDRVLRYYAAHWKRGRAVLIGYSQGANVLPFAVNRLPAASRPLLAQTVLMGLEQKAAWEFHVGNWLGGTRDAVPIQPEALRLRAATTLCLYGADERDSLCPQLPATSVTARQMPGGHHFDGAYDKLAAMILERLPR